MQQLGYSRQPIESLSKHASQNIHNSGNSVNVEGMYASLIFSYLVLQGQLGLVDNFN